MGYLRVDASDNSLLEFKAPTGSEVIFDVDANETITVAGSLNIEADSNINQDLTTDASPSFTALGLGVAVPTIELDIVTSGTTCSGRFDQGTRGMGIGAGTGAPFLEYTDNLLFLSQYEADKPMTFL